MDGWSGNVVPEKNDIVLRTRDRELLRLVGNGFTVDGKAADDAQIVAALRTWLAASSGRAEGRSEVGEIVLTIAPTPGTSVSKLPARSQSALEALRNALKERENTKAKAIAAVADLLSTFQRIMRPFFVELGSLARSLGSEQLGPMFNGGGLINTIQIDGIFGFEWLSGEYIHYHTGVRRLTTPRELAQYLVESHPDMDVEAALNKVVTGVHQAHDGIVKKLSSMERIRLSAEAACQTLKNEETRLLEGPKNETKMIEGPKP